MMRSTHGSRSIVTALAVVATLVLVPALTAQSRSVPELVEINTLFEASLDGEATHTVRIDEPGPYGMFIGAADSTTLAVTLPGGRMIEHDPDEASNNFLFFDVGRNGDLTLDFEAGSDDDPSFYAFVVTRVVELSVDGSTSVDLLTVPMGSEPDYTQGMRLFRVRAKEDALLTIEVGVSRYEISMMFGSPDGRMTPFNPYTGSPSAETTVFQVPIEAGKDHGLIILREFLNEEELRGVELSLSTSELVEPDPVELAFGDPAVGVIDATAPIFEGRRVAPYYFNGTAGESIGIVVESLEFDAYLTVFDPDGFEYSDDDSAGGTDSLLRIPSAIPGTYTIYALSYDGISTGEFRVEVNEYESGPDAESAAATGMVEGSPHDGEISASSAVYRGALVEVYEFELPSPADVTVELSSTEIDTYLYVVLPDGTVIENDDDGGFTDSRVRIEDAQRGVYRVYASAYGGDSPGRFQLLFATR